MKTQEYFEKSKKEKVSKKCPLYERCQRCAFSLYFLSGLDQENYKSVDIALEEEGLWKLKEDEDLILQIGSVVSKIGGINSLYFENVCPEVSLFSNGTRSFIPKKSVTKGSWDNFYKKDKFGEDGKFEVLEEGHFTECREFIDYQTKSKNYTKLSPPTQYVYLMLNKRSGHFKIGRSVNPRFREKTLQSQEPEVELVESCLAPKEFENELHKQFASKRIRGEWFELEDNDLKLIADKMNEYQNE